MIMLSKLPVNLYEKIKEGESTTVEFKKAKENYLVHYLKRYAEC